MSDLDPPLKTIRTLEDTSSLSSNDLCEVSFCSTTNNSDLPLISSSILHPLTKDHSKCIQIQHSLRMLVILHMLRSLISCTLELDHYGPRRSLLRLKEGLPTFFKKVGYVSHSFFQSAL
ncbi:hypothetical protein GEMRC1_010571 [Eukaryota sp. GEM-RC1]